MMDCGKNSEKIPIFPEIFSAMTAWEYDKPSGGRRGILL